MLNFIYTFIIQQIKLKVNSCYLIYLHNFTIQLYR
nr:MAG TPA: hypothetical protein [Caudoviricetes sp.]